MHIATLNSEKLLLADLRETRISHPTHRCLHLSFSKAIEDKSVWLPVLKRAIRQSLDGAYTQIYITHDQDVFILGWGLTLRRLDDMIMMMAYELNGATLQGSANLYELAMQWEALEKLCLDKLERAEILTRHHNQVDTPPAPLTCDDVIDAIDMRLVKTIARRRAKRDKAIIMVAEDDAFSRMLIKKSLDDDYQLAFAKDGQGAILSYIRQAPDILFLDIGLPDINGHDVLQKIMSMDPQAYIVMFSGNGDRENVIKALENGAQGFVGKPFTKEKLLQYIQKMPRLVDPIGIEPTTSTMPL